MHFLVDVHLPVTLSKFLHQHQHCKSTHVNQILQRWNTTDKEICNYADANNMIVVTKDADFKNSHFINNTPLKVIRITLGNTSNADLLKLFEKYIEFLLPLHQKRKFYIEISATQLNIIE